MVCIDIKTLPVDGSNKTIRTYILAHRQILSDVSKNSAMVHILTTHQIKQQLTIHYPPNAMTTKGYINYRNTHLYILYKKALVIMIQASLGCYEMIQFNKKTRSV